MYTYKKSSKFGVIDSVECYIVISTPKDLSKEIYSKHETGRHINSGEITELFEKFSK